MHLFMTKKLVIVLSASFDSLFECNSSRCHGSQVSVVLLIVLIADISDGLSHCKLIECSSSARLM